MRYRLVKVKNGHICKKMSYDLLQVVTGSNIDLGEKALLVSSIRREQSAVIVSLSLASNRFGVVSILLPVSVMKNDMPGKGLRVTSSLMADLVNFDSFIPER